MSEDGVEKDDRPELLEFEVRETLVTRLIVWGCTMIERYITGVLLLSDSPNSEWVERVDWVKQICWVDLMRINEEDEEDFLREIEFLLSSHKRYKSETLSDCFWELRQIGSEIESNISQN